MPPMSEEEERKARKRERNKAYREANKERIKEQKKAHYEANKEEILKRQKAYGEANKEKKAAYDKVYREANKERIKEQKKAHYKANKERIAEQKKVYRESNKEKIAEQKKAYCEANKERIREKSRLYYKANKEKYLYLTAKRKALKKKLIPKPLRKCPIEKDRLVKIYKLRAIISEATGVQHHVDHMWPLSDGGPHWSGNLQIITAEENLSKNASVCEETKKAIQESLEYALQEYKKEKRCT